MVDSVRLESTNRSPLAEKLACLMLPFNCISGIFNCHKSPSSIPEVFSWPAKRIGKVGNSLIISTLLRLILASHLSAVCQSSWPVRLISPCGNLILAWSKEADWLVPAPTISTDVSGKPSPLIKPLASILYFCALPFKLIAKLSN